jgi:glycosyltransferase involved in cell wall biosynthesis
MAASRPYILSDIPVFREITEDKGVYFNPENTDSILNAIESVINSPILQKQLINYGNERVKFFNYDHLSLELLHFYKKFI